MPNSTSSSRYSGRTTISLTPATDRVRMCSKSGHGDRKAVGIRVVTSTAPSYVAYCPECAECAKRALKATKKLTEDFFRFTR